MSELNIGSADNLYGIHNLDDGTITLIYADSIREARDKVLGVPEEER